MISPEKLIEIENLASLFFTAKEIAILVGIDISEFLHEIRNGNSDVYLAYQRGKLKSEMEIREQIVKMAKLGSPAAQESALGLIKKMKIKEQLHG